MARRILSVAVGAWLIGMMPALGHAANAQDRATAGVRASQTADAQDPLVTPPGPVWWASAEALAWSVKSMPLPPTLTTFAPGSASAATGAGGDLGVPGTSVLSPSNMGYGTTPGARFTLGRWLDGNSMWGVEGEGFFLASRTANFSANSSGSPPLRVPFTNVPPGDGFPLGSSSFVLADPGFAFGGQTINSSLQFWGAEGNALYRALDTGPYHLSLLAGVRYLDLREGLLITSSETVPIFGSYQGADNFATRNQFIGGQIGAKAQAQFNQFDASLIAKVALGDINQSVDINGSSVVSGFGGPVTPTVTPGGIFTQTTNIGRQNRNAFGVVPEAQFQLGYSLPHGIRVSVGYDFIYFGNVVRPGNQIDTTLNLTTNPAISGPGVTPAGAARPQPMFSRSSFWAQGVTVGLTIKF